MDDNALGTLPIVALTLGGLIVLAAAGGGIMYMTDTQVGATVIAKDCASLPGAKASKVTIETEFPVPGIEHTLKQFDNTICNGLRSGENGNYAEYYLKSERTVLFEREGGKCLYDSDGLVC